MQNYFDSADEFNLSQQEDDVDDDDDNSDNNIFDRLKAMKIGSLFQAMFFILHNGRKRTPLHIMNAVEIYEKCQKKSDI